MQSYLRSHWGKATAVLAALAVFGGVAAEFVAIKRTTNEGVIALWMARYADLKQHADAIAAKYKAEIARQVAVNAEIRKKADADLRAAEAEIEQVNSTYAHQQADADTRKTEAELKNLKSRIAIIEPIIVKCIRPCAAKLTGRPKRYGELSGAGCIADCSYGNSLNNAFGR